jgi:hypothetical protein
VTKEDARGWVRRRAWKSCSDSARGLRGERRGGIDPAVKEAETTDEHQAPPPNPPTMSGLCRPKRRVNF